MGMELAPLTPMALGSAFDRQFERQASSAPLEADASEVTSYLVMSGERHAQDPHFIRSHRITHVLNLTATPFNGEVETLATCLALPLTDTTSQDITPVLQPAIDFIGLLLANPFTS